MTQTELEPHVKSDEGKINKDLLDQLKQELRLQMNGNSNGNGHRGQRLYSIYPNGESPRIRLKRKDARKRPFNTIDLSSKLPTTKTLIRFWRRNYPSLDTLGQTLLLGEEFNLSQGAMTDLRDTVCEVIASAGKSGNPIQGGVKEQMIEYVTPRFAASLIGLSITGVSYIARNLGLPSNHWSLQDIADIRQYRNTHHVGRPRLK